MQIIGVNIIIFTLYVNSKVNRISRKLLGIERAFLQLGTLEKLQPFEEMHTYPAEAYEHLTKDVNLEVPTILRANREEPVERFESDALQGDVVYFDPPPAMGRDN